MVSAKSRLDVPLDHLISGCVNWIDFQKRSLSKTKKSSEKN